MATKPQNLGILHPGEMGVSIAASAQNSGHTVYWASEGRSGQTAERAAKIGLLDAGTLANLRATCSAIFSVCPPDAAEALAESVMAQGFTGLYIDMNAISPERAIRIGAAVEQGGATFVDGGIIGGPAWKPGTTWLYLSGAAAEKAADYFAAGPLGTRVIGVEIGKASAVKMCFSAYTKGVTALLSAALAASEALGVRAELQELWARDSTGFAGQAAERARQASPKAWRFVGEMAEISDTFRAAGVPGEFHAAAAEIYRRMAGFKDAPALPEIEAILAAVSGKV
jgi:3-hydroxyisobutyrate dehydrogenase-like beta-hydroxyacid dehydrogenase